MDIELLRSFHFEKVLNDDPLIHSLTVLGSLPLVASTDFPSRAPAIILLQRTHLSIDTANNLVQNFIEHVRSIESNDIYYWLFGWLARSSEFPDIKINVVFPATNVHIRKYSRQRKIMVKETPELYRMVVQPFIEGIPPSRLEWVYNILSHNVESHKLLYEDPNPQTGFVILPDMKWDTVTISSLYLVAIIHSRTVTTLRDLTQEHVPMLKSVRCEAARIVRERWGLDGEHSLRFFVHYQPSYYHFHVHIVNVNYAGFKGISAGQAHILEDIISLLELSPSTGPSILSQMTLTYELGEQHGLYEPMLKAQQTIDKFQTPS